MNISLLSQFSLAKVSFKAYSSQDLKKLSVLEVTNPVTFDALGHPTKNGLHDPALGPSRRDDICSTCSLGASGRDECPGHFGHISLPLPVYSPFFIRQMFQLLSMCCFNCHSLLFQPTYLQVVLAQLTALDHGLDYLVDELQTVANDLITNVKGPNSAEFITYLENHLKEVIENALKSNSMNLNSKCDSIQVKNIIDRKQHLLKALLQGKLIKIQKNCPNCTVRKWTMSLVNNSMVLMSQPRVSAKHIGLPVKTDIKKSDEDDNSESVLKDKIQEVDVNIGGKSYLTPLVARDHLKKLFKNETKTLKLMLKLLDIDGDDDSALDAFFMDTVPVTPPRFRPLHMMGGKFYEDEATSMLTQVMMAADNLKNALKELQNLKTTDENSSKEKSKEMAKLHQNWSRLQILCNRIYDNEMDKLPEKKGPGVRQVLEKKEGLFRKNMMGKRVNYAARSVISPDPYISVDEIGIPEIFATRLSYPQPVTPWNLEEMKKAVLNGPEVHPGALSVSFDDGSVIRLKANDSEQRARIANILGQNRPGSRTVNRHLITGDILLLNRQPTLHKPSIMAHKARVLKREKTLRLHYSNCKCYNADFDGDEMNAHFPQSELARAEAYNIVSVNKQYLVPKDGSPLGGLIQDHIVSSTLLTMRGNFFNRRDYQQLVFSALANLKRPIKLVKPAIWRPVPLWSGKQIITTLILNLVPQDKAPPTLYIPAKVNNKTLSRTNPRKITTTHFFTPPTESMSDASVVVRHGEVLKGLIDKANIGPTPYGLIHCCYELYGGEVSNALLTAFARLCTVYLQIHGGVTLGIEDILVNKEADAIRRRIIKKSTTVGDEAAAEALGLPKNVDKSILTKRLREWHASADPALMKTLDSCMKGKTDEVNNGITKACLPAGLIKQFPHNNLQLMIQSGAKGGTVNALQISCLLGQIELEGKRVPLMMSGRTLPSFVPYDTSPKAGGFVTGRFLTGIRPQEFFFHCMAGREGLIDTAVKTSRSGYLQRCLIKHLEGLTVNYDSTVRDTDGSLVQLQYGEDGIDILKNQLLKPNAMSLLIHNSKILMPSEEELAKLRPSIATRRAITQVKQDIENWEIMNGKNRLIRRQGSGFQEYFDVKMRDAQQTTGKTELDPEAYNKIIDSWFGLEKSDKEKLNFYFQPCPGPLTSDFPPNYNFGVVSEKLEYQIQNYLKTSKEGLIRDGKYNMGDEKWKGKHIISSSDLKKLIYTRYMKSLADPGEAVGLLAAQSIGEPSTQMTLNTFHFAGRGDMNVTLGIPRLREILMTASPKIATPNMDLPFRSDLGSNAAKKAERIRRKLNAVKLSEVLETIDVTENLSINHSNCSRFYDITFRFLPHSLYKKKLNVKPKTILEFIETKFILILIAAIKRASLIQRKYNSLYDHSMHHRETKGGDGEEENEQAQPARTENLDAMSSDEEDNAVEEDTHAVRTKAHRNQELDYDEPEEEEIEANKNDDEEQSEQVITLEGDDEVRPKVDEDEEANQEDQHNTIAQQVAKAQKEAKVQAAKALRECQVKEKDNCIDMYDYDAANQEWSRVVFKFPLKDDKVDVASIVEDEARKAYVHKIGSIERAFLVDDREASKRGCSFGKMVKTEGVCFLDLVNYQQIFDLNRVYSNDLHAIANTYGIEAAKRALTIEIANVFSVYGIEVDPRHLSLIADYMTFDGTIKGMNRMSMAGSSSPLQQMTFETTAAFLKSALLLGFKDELKSPSARIFAGRPPLGGTGLLGLMQDGTVEYKTIVAGKGSKFTKSPHKSFHKLERKRRFSQNAIVDKDKFVGKKVRFA